MEDTPLDPCLVNPITLTGLNNGIRAMLVHRSSRGKDGFGLESKESKKGPIESMQIELKSKTLTLGEKSGGAYQGLTTVSNAELYTEPVRRRNRENGPPLAGIQLPVRARLRAPQRGRSTVVRSHGGECARRRMDPRRRRHPSRPAEPFIASTQWLPPLVERGKGEGENDPRVWGAATATRGLIWRKPRTTVRS